MTRILKRMLALAQVPIALTAHFAPHEAQGGLGFAWQPTKSDLHSWPTTGTVPASSQTDRPDPFVCESQGLNDCWRPSEIQDGPPYMGQDVWPTRSKICVVPAGSGRENHWDDRWEHRWEGSREGSREADDSAAILHAFSQCKEDGHIIFENTTYHIRKVMNTTGLRDVDIELRGTLLWSADNIPYWLENSLPIGFQNQSSAWHLGGENIHFYGHGYGTFNGNGQAWYDFNQGVSNRHGRPHALTITDTKNSVFEGLRFIKSQMWTMDVIRSEKVLVQDIYVNNTSDNDSSNSNTDGVDTTYANNITFLRWTIDNGDDAISMKQNSTNIYIADCVFYNGMSLAMGSIGQYPGQIEIMENITAENIRVVDSGYAGRVKTWTGENKGYPPNGGGGGLGHAKNITFRNFVLDNVNVAWAIGQCVSYNGMSGGCDSSEFQVQDMHWGNAVGTLKTDKVATLQCSASAPCPGIELFNNELQVLGQDGPADRYLCDGVIDPEGFDCTAPCNGECPTE